MTDTRALREEERVAMERAAEDVYGEHQGEGANLSAGDFEAGFIAGLRYRDEAEELGEVLRKCVDAIEYARDQELSGRHHWLDDAPILAALEAARKASP